MLVPPGDWLMPLKGAFSPQSACELTEASDRLAHCPLPGFSSSAAVVTETPAAQLPSQPGESSGSSRRCQAQQP